MSERWLYISDSPVSLFHDMLKPLIVIVIVLTLVLIFSGGVLEPFSSLPPISSKGELKVMGVGVYWDRNCTVAVYSLDWGSVEPSSAKNMTVFVRNEGNQPSTLYLNTTNWYPTEASKLMMLNWDYDGQVVRPLQVIRVSLVLSVSTSAERMDHFTFDILIGASEYG